MAFMGIVFSIMLIPVILLFALIGKIMVEITSVGGIALSVAFIVIYRKLKEAGKFSADYYYGLLAMPHGKYRYFGMRFLRFGLIAGAILSALAAALCIIILMFFAALFT